MADAEAIFREVWRRWNSGDRELDEATFDPEFEVHSALANRTYRGPDQVREWIAEIDDQFEAWQLEIDGVRELGGDRMLAGGTIRGRGRKSGIDLDQPAAWIVGFRRGRMLSVRNFIGSDAYERAEAAAVSD